MIYIASPYSGTAEQMKKRHAEVAFFTAIGTKLGFSLYSPIVHFADIAAIQQMPADFAFWKLINFDHIRCADVFFNLCLDGWRESKGMQAENQYALNISKPMLAWQPDEGYSLPINETAVTEFWEELHQQMPTLCLKRQFN